MNTTEKLAEISSENNLASVQPNQRLAQAFRTWEEGGRGWDVSTSRVALEPLLRSVDQAAMPTPVRDDARQPTLLGGMIEKSRRRLSRPAIAEGEPSTQAPQRGFKDNGDLVELQVVLPPQLKVSPDASEQFLLSLSYCSFPISFEVIGLGHCMMVQFACRKTDRSQLQQQVIAHFPEAIVAESSDTLAGFWSPGEKQSAVVIEFGLASEFMRPLSTFKSFEPDPLIAVTGALSKLQAGEVGVLQVLFQATRQPWADHIMRAVTDAEGKPLFADAPEVTALAKQKITRPLFATVIRVAALCQSEDRAWRVARSLGASLRRFANPASNELIALSNDDYPLREHESDLLDRSTHRSGMLLNSEELAAILHVPSASVRAEKLIREAKKTKTAPQVALGHEVVLGTNTHRGQTKEITLSPEQRLRHCFLVGSSGSGKTTLLKTMATQDISNGDGVCVIDPHSDFINDLLAQVPEERYGDVIIFDPSDECPVPFNVLSAHSEMEKNLLASDLASLFRRQCTTWGDQMDAILTNAILAFLESDQGGTLTDLRRFLVEPDFRKAFLNTVKDEEVVYFWRREFPLLRGKPQAPILTRLNAFLRPKPIRRMVSQQTGSLDFRSVMDNRKILLVKLAQGAIGMDNSHLLGSLVLSKLHQLALSRQDTDESKRANFFIFCDEAQYFLTPSVTALLSAARKFHVGLTLATQSFFHLWNIDKEVASAVLANPYTRICFQLGDIDAKKLEDGFSSYFEARDLQNLGVGEAIVRLGRNDCDFNLKTLMPPRIDADQAKIRHELITELSRRQYGCKPEQTSLQFGIGSVSEATQPPKHVWTVQQGQPESQSVRAPELPSTKPRDQQSRVPEISPAQLGRGGQQHKYLQNLIKRLAEDRGFHVTIEHPVLSGTGSVDVSLERAGRKIACEISVSSTSAYELRNVQKCFSAGFDQVVVLSAEKKVLSKIQKLITSELDAESSQRALCLLPEEFIEFLDRTDAEQVNAETTVQGYKVKLKYKQGGRTEQAAQRQAIAQVILQALKRLKGERCSTTVFAPWLLFGLM